MVSLTWAVESLLILLFIVLSLYKRSLSENLRHTALVSVEADLGISLLIICMSMWCVDSD